MQNEEYRYEATSVAGVLQQLAACHLRDGYHFYVSGEVREGRDPFEIDRAILGRYEVAISKYQRHQRKKRGLANLHYLRYRRRFLILATAGGHLFYRREVDIRDVRRVPIKFEGHSVGYRGRHASVRIEDQVFRDLKAYFQGIATARPAAVIGRELRGLPYVRFAPVRTQVYGLWKEVNRLRTAAGLDGVPRSYVEGGRKVCRPFEPATLDDDEVGEGHQFRPAPMSGSGVNAVTDSAGGGESPGLHKSKRRKAGDTAGDAEEGILDGEGQHVDRMPQPSSRC